MGPQPFQNQRIGVSAAVSQGRWCASTAEAIPEGLFRGTLTKVPATTIYQKLQQFPLMCVKYILMVLGWKHLSWSPAGDLHVPHQAEVQSGSQ